MFTQQKGDYRLEGNHLYKKQGNAFIHVMIVPPGVKGINKAIALYERGECR